MADDGNIGGIYTDPFHSPITAGANVYGVSTPWLGGLRILSPRPDDASKFICIGCDDGIHFWVLNGCFVGDTVAADGTGRAVTMDFSPKAPGVGLLNCSYEPGRLSFLGGAEGKTIENTWSRLKPTAEFETTPLGKHDAFNSVNGMWIDPSLQKSGTFAGLRIASDRFGKWIQPDGKITVLGTDDGLTWSVLTESGKLAGELGDEVDFGTSLGKAKVKNGDLDFKGGTKWTKVAAKTEFHTMPKGE